MNYVCGPLILYSQDKIRMMDFLSDVFEFEVDTEDDVVQNGMLNLKLVEFEAQEKNQFQSSGIRFDFKLKGSAEIQEILSKFNFFLYRKSDQKLSEEILEHVVSNQGERLMIKDIDGRVWQFEVGARHE